LPVPLAAQDVPAEELHVHVIFSRFVEKAEVTEAPLTARGPWLETIILYLVEPSTMTDETPSLISI
jgi:hypothetical protein